MESNKEGKLVYKVLSSNVDYHYKHLTIKVWINQDETQYSESSSQVLSIAWQSDDKDYSRWYAGGIETTLHTLDQIVEVGKLFKKIFPAGYIDTPQTLITTLRERKAIHVVYDPRIDESRPLDQIFNNEYAPFRDDNEAAGNDSFYTNILARADSDMESLQYSVNLAFLHFINDRPYDSYITAYHNWFNAGKPVKRVTSEWRTRLPDYRTVDELLSGKEVEREYRV